MKRLLFLILLFPCFCFGQSKRSFVSSSEFKEQVAPHGYARLITAKADTLFSVFKATVNHAVFKRKYSGNYSEHYVTGLKNFDAQMDRGNISGPGYFYYSEGEIKMKVLMLSGSEWIQRTVYNYDEDGNHISVTVHDLKAGTETTIKAK